MKKIVFLLCCTVFFSCHESDLEIDRIDFTSVQVLSCERNIAPRFLFKIQGNQVLILELPDGTLANRPQKVEGKIPMQYKLIYRTFDGAVSQSYFCYDYPPFSPKPITEIQAKGGSVFIETQEIIDEKGEVSYHHLISISDVVLQNDSGEKIIDSRLDFGVFITKQDE